MTKPPIQLNNDPEWLARQAADDDDDGSIVSVGGSAMKRDAFIKAIAIFRKYRPDAVPAADGGGISFGVNPNEISEEDKAELKKLGWTPIQVENTPNT